MWGRWWWQLWGKLTGDEVEVEYHSDDSSHNEESDHEESEEEDDNDDESDSEFSDTYDSSDESDTEDSEEKKKHILLYRRTGRKIWANRVFFDTI